jgi:hypothetical protein
MRKACRAIMTVAMTRTCRSINKSIHMQHTRVGRTISTPSDVIIPSILVIFFSLCFSLWLRDMASAREGQRIEVDIPVSPELSMTFSPSSSVSHRPGEQQQDTSTSSAAAATAMDENAPLLGTPASKKKEKKSFYRPRPLWFVCVT